MLLLVLAAVCQFSPSSAISWCWLPTGVLGLQRFLQLQDTMPFVTTHMHEIRPRLWLGNKDAEAILLRDLQNLGITHILQVVLVSFQRCLKSPDSALCTIIEIRSAIKSAQRQLIS